MLNIARLKRINKNVYEGIYHEYSEKENGRQKIEPGFFIVIFHDYSLSSDSLSKINTL